MSRQSKRIQTGETTGLRLWLVLWKAYMAVRNYASQNISSLGLGMSDFGVLEILLHRGPLPVNEIGRKISLTSGSITTAVDRLVERGLVERQDSPDDRRARIVHLTKDGRKLIDCAFAAHEEAMNSLGEVLDPDEREQAARLLKRLGRHAESLFPEGV